MWPEGAFFYAEEATCLPVAFQQKYRIACNINFLSNLTVITISGVLLVSKVRKTKNAVRQLQQEQPSYDENDIRVIKMVIMPIAINTALGGE